MTEGDIGTFLDRLLTERDEAIAEVSVAREELKIALADMNAAVTHLKTLTDLNKERVSLLNPGSDELPTEFKWKRWRAYMSASLWLVTKGYSNPDEYDSVLGEK